MEQPKPNPTKVATKWALINFIASIIITYAIYYLSADPNSPLKYIGYLPFIAFLLLAQKEFKDQLGGYLTFGEGFSAALRYSIFTSLMIAVFTFIYLTFLNPDIMAQAAEQARAKLQAQGNMSSEDIDKAVNITKKIGPAIGSIVIAIVDIIVGIIVGLIGASVFKRERSAFDPEPIDPAV